MSKLRKAAKKMSKRTGYSVAACMDALADALPIAATAAS